MGLPVSASPLVLPLCCRASSCNEPAMLVSLGAPAHFQLDWRVFFLAGLLALITMLLLALVPLAQVARPQLVPALRSASSQRTEDRNPAARRVAVWLQIGISFALLVSTGALVQSFLNTRTQSIGLTRNQVLVAFTQDPDTAIRDTVLTNLRALPGVRSVAYGIRSPLMPSEGGIAEKVLLPSHPELRDPVDIKFNAVSPGFLDVTGTHVVRGRGFTEADNADGPVTVLINRTMAQKYWPGQDPVGQVVRLPDGHVDARVARRHRRRTHQPDRRDARALSLHPVPAVPGPPVEHGRDHLRDRNPPERNGHGARVRARSSSTSIRCSIRCSLPRFPNSFVIRRATIR